MEKALVKIDYFTHTAYNFNILLKKTHSNFKLF